MILSRLHKVDTNSVFYSPTLGAVRQDYFNGLTNGTMVGYATDGTVMNSQEAVDAFLLMCDFMSQTNGVIDEIYRNIQVGDIIISMVRSEIVTIPNGGVYLAKLASVVGAIQTGMFDTASQLLLAITPDAVLTTERLTRWADMAITADAIEVVE